MPLKLWFRRDWGAKYWKKIRKVWLEPLYHPVPYILLYYHSFIKTCTDDVTCKKNMKKIQKYHIQFEGFADIAYNFVVSGDGTVYEGRGLIIKSELLDEKYRKYHGKSLDLAFLGDFRDGAPEQMHEAVSDFVDFGIEFGYIKQNPEIIEINDKIIDFSKLGTKPANTIASDKKRTQEILGKYRKISSKPKVKKTTQKPIKPIKPRPSMFKPLNLAKLV